MKIVSALCACVLLLAGCGGSSSADEAPAEDGSTSTAAPTSTSPSPAPTDAGVTVDIVLKGGAVTPQGKRIDVRVGQKVTLHVTSDADEELHVHSDPEHEFEVSAGDDESFSFTIDTPGQVAVEAHHLDVTIVQLVVRP
ncbi:hypothetical protein C6I20_12765 [Aeromicrobium sp. A1-2]|uniref:hypothetical protein n=1 Tax=Aeromicrobium sp. A1-2 TaxID=2107713 RepID=UPI000E54EE3D|nr:hypothetical protein [Aeromicrobium sp. A1-2]AXT85966.1 hypothetical protein C6I20_12765 [Aeromicrobium sp. A1-2]